MTLSHQFDLAKKVLLCDSYTADQIASIRETIKWVQLLPDSFVAEADVKDLTDTLVDYGFDQKSARHIAVSIMHNGYFTWYFLA